MPKATRIPPKGRLSASGQYLPKSGGCIATLRSGCACPLPRATKLMPYCKKCMKTGDPSLKAVSHPRFGKILVATRNLPKGYYAAWWGKLCKKKEVPYKRMEWALETSKGMVDAVPYKGSQLKYCACPGPSEVPTIDFAPNSDVLLKSGEKLAAVMFQTLRPIPRNWQLDMMYNKDEKSTDEFFQERGLTRGDVGTKRYPAERKKKAGPPAWKMPKRAMSVMKNMKQKSKKKSS